MVKVLCIDLTDLRDTPGTFPRHCVQKRGWISEPSSTTFTAGYTPLHGWTGIFSRHGVQENGRESDWQTTTCWLTDPHVLEGSPQDMMYRNVAENQTVKSLHAG